jgi:hypothetical protein
MKRERDAAWTDRYLDGLTIVEIATASKRPMSTIYAAIHRELTRRGIPRASHYDKRNTEFANRYLAGESIVKIAGEAQITRQRVSQIVRRDLNSRGIKMMDKRLSGVRFNQTQFEKVAAEFTRRITLGRRCPVCQGPNLRAESLKTCSTECAQVWQSSRRYWLSPEEHERHRVQQARTILRHPERYKPSSVAWAHKMLSDNPPPPNRRYVINANKEKARVIGAPTGR